MRQRAPGRAAAGALGAAACRHAGRQMGRGLCRDAALSPARRGRARPHRRRAASGRAARWRGGRPARPRPARGAAALRPCAQHHADRHRQVAPSARRRAVPPLPGARAPATQRQHRGPHRDRRAPTGGQGVSDRTAARCARAVRRQRRGGVRRRPHRQADPQLRPAAQHLDDLSGRGPDQRRALGPGAVDLRLALVGGDLQLLFHRADLHLHHRALARDPGLHHLSPGRDPDRQSDGAHPRPGDRRAAAQRDDAGALRLQPQACGDHQARRPDLGDRLSGGPDHEGRDRHPPARRRGPAGAADRLSADRRARPDAARLRYPTPTGISCP